MRSLLALLCAGLLSITSAQAASEKSRASNQLEFGVRMALKGSWREAAFRFEKAIQYDSENPYAYNNLGVALETVGDFEGARSAYARALEMLPDNDRIRENMEQLEAYISSRAHMAPLPTDSARPGGAGSTPERRDEAPEEPEEERDDGS